jgi:hypothetical protein
MPHVYDVCMHIYYEQTRAYDQLAIKHWHISILNLNSVEYGLCSWRCELDTLLKEITADIRQTCRTIYAVKHCHG